MSTPFQHPVIEDLTISLVVRRLKCGYKNYLHTTKRLTFVVYPCVLAIFGQFERRVNELGKCAKGMRITYE